MSATYEIPLNAAPQTFNVVFPNGVTYSMRLIYQFNEDDCWLLDIGDAAGNPLVCGIPLITGADLLAQYAYLGFGAKLFCFTTGDFNEPPHWWNLGGAGQLLIEG